MIQSIIKILRNANDFIIIMKHQNNHLRGRFCGGGGAFDFLPERCSALELSSGIVGAEDRYLWGVVWSKFRLCV